MTRVLIADDTVSGRELLRFILEDSGYLVAAARDGQEALEILPGFRPHLIILDLEMPRLDGCAAAIAMRRMVEARTTPMVALTAALTQTDPDRIAEAGFSAYLIKPIAPSQLRRCIAQYI